MNADVAQLTTVDRALGDETPLPRDNGELVFEEPWQGRALGMGVVALERTGASWAEFREHLAAAITARPEFDGESPATAYYACWIDALEALLAERGLLERTSSDSAGQFCEQPLDHADSERRGPHGRDQT